MDAFRKGIAGVLLLCACNCALAQTSAQPAGAAPINPNGPGPMPNNGPVRLMNEASSATGTIIRRDLVWNPSIPLDKTYAQFSPDEKAAFDALYESCGKPCPSQFPFILDLRMR